MSSDVNLKLIKFEREKKHLTMDQMAKALNIRDKSGYYKRESGNTNFKVSELPVLVSILEIPYEKIFLSSLRKSKQKFTSI